MSKKDYILIARMLHEGYSRSLPDTQHRDDASTMLTRQELATLDATSKAFSEGYWYAVEKVCNALGQDSTRFDRAKFLTAVKEG